MCLKGLNKTFLPAFDGFRLKINQIDRIQGNPIFRIRIRMKYKYTAELGYNDHCNTEFVLITNNNE